MLQNPRAGFTTNGICGSSSAKSSFPSSSAVHARKKKSSSICAKSLRMATLSLSTVMACVRLGLVRMRANPLERVLGVGVHALARGKTRGRLGLVNQAQRPPGRKSRALGKRIAKHGCCEDSSHSNNCGEAYGSSRMTTATPFSSGRRKRGPSKHNKRVYPHQPKAARPASSRHAKSSARQA